MRWWRMLCRLVACLVYCNSPLHRKKPGASCFWFGQHSESNSLSIDIAALIAVMRLVCLNSFNNTRFACQDFKRESFSLTHMPGSPQPSACWRIWTCCAKKTISLMDVCCNVLNSCVLSFSFLSGNAKFCIPGYGGEYKACIHSSIFCFSCPLLFLSRGHSVPNLSWLCF